MRPSTNTVNEKISSIFNNTQPVLPGMNRALGVSGLNSDISKIEQGQPSSKVSHPLIVEASDADMSTIHIKKQ